MSGRDVGTTQSEGGGGGGGGFGQGHTVVQLIEALRYKLEGREFNSRCCHWNFSLT